MSPPACATTPIPRPFPRRPPPRRRREGHRRLGRPSQGGRRRPAHRPHRRVDAARRRTGGALPRPMHSGLGGAEDQTSRPFRQVRPPSRRLTRCRRSRQPAGQRSTTTHAPRRLGFPRPGGPPSTKAPVARRCHVVHQRGLTDAWLTTRHEHLAVMRAHVGHEPIQYLALADPANQTGPLLTPHHAHRPDDDGRAARYSSPDGGTRADTVSRSSTRTRPVCWVIAHSSEADRASSNRRSRSRRLGILGVVLGHGIRRRVAC
jgi:hypothetical protein